MTTTIDYALLAGDSYYDTRVDINRFPVPQNWSVVSRVPQDGLTGFEASTYKNSLTNEIVISFAGTYPSDILGDQATNLSMASGLGSTQLLQAVDYYLQVKALNPNATVTFTGHSLGGGIAALMGVFFGKQAVTFDQAPFANTAEPGLLGTPSYAFDIKTYLLGKSYTDPAMAAVRDAAVAQLSTYLQDQQINGGIPNSDLVTNICVQGEFLSTAPLTLFNRIGTTINEIPNSSSGVSGFSLHAQSLLTAFLQSDATAIMNAGQKQSLSQVTFKLTDLLGMIFDNKLYSFDTDKGDANFLEHLVRHQAGGVDGVQAGGDAMVTRFTDDLWKIAQDGGLTMSEGTNYYGIVNNVSKALTAFAMQFYYEDTANAVNPNKQLFTDLSTAGTGSNGLQFDMGDVSAKFAAAITANEKLNLTDAKGYELYFKNYIDTTGNFTPSEQQFIKALLPYMRDWYVQAGNSGMDATDTLNCGAFMLGGSGSDTLVGGTDADLLVGNAGDDILIGREGNDFLIGGAGDDYYVYNAGDGFDTILDSDGNGSVVVDGAILAGGGQYGDGRVHKDDSGHLYVDIGTGLIIDNNILVLNYSSTQGNHMGLSMTVPDAQTNPQTTLTINGDISPTDIDLSAPGIQAQGDAQGNPLGTSQPYEDILYGSAGNDHIQSGELTDLVVGYGGIDWIEGGNGNDYLIGDGLIEGDAGSDVLYGGGGNDQFYGDTKIDIATAIHNGNTDIATNLRGDWLSPGSGDDTLVTGAGDDVLAGGGGNDLIIAGAGNDLIFGDSDYTTVLIMPGGTPRYSIGNTDWYSVSQDTFNWQHSFTGDNLTFTTPYAGGPNPADSGNDVIYAGAGADHVWASAGNDIVFGEAGNDVIVGDEGNDIILGGADNDKLWGGAGSDYLDGGDGNDTISGDEGDDILIGGIGNDSLYGGSGKDTYIYNLGDGIDHIIDSNVDNNTLQFGTGISASDITLRLGSLMLDLGNGNTVHIDGFNQNDVFNSSSISSFEFADGSTLTTTELLAWGFDIVGTEGNDAYSTTFSNGIITIIDKRLYGTNTTDRIYGLGGNDALYGLAGNDTLDGGTGADTLYGGTGDDTYVVDNVGDIIAENATEGIDTVQSSISYTFGNNLENLALTGMAAINGKGNNLNNVLVGNAGNNVLSGFAGNDTYLFNRGDGTDTLADNGDFNSIDTLQFGADILQSDVTISRIVNGDLAIKINGTTDVVVVQGYYTNASNRIEHVVFGDGKVLTNTDFDGLPISSVVLFDNGKTTTAYFDANGTKLRDTWTKTDGSHGMDTFFADGTMSGTSYNADGSYSSSYNNGRGYTNTTNFDANGNDLGSTWAYVSPIPTNPTYDSNGAANGTIYNPDGSFVWYYGISNTSGAATAPGAMTFWGPPNTVTYYTEAQYYDANGKLLYDFWSNEGFNSGVYTKNADNIITNTYNDIYQHFTETSISYYDGHVNTQLSGYRVQDDGSYWTFTHNADGSTSRTDGDIYGNFTTTNYDVSNVKLNDSWTKVDGSYGSDTFSVDGSYIGIAHDGQGRTTTTNYGVWGNKLNDSWTKTDGTYGNDTFNADGSSSGIIYNSDGSHSSYVNDGMGHLTSTYYDVSGNPVNRTPLVDTALADQSGTQGQAFNFTIPSTTFSDPDTGDTLQLSATLASGLPLPAWLIFDATTQTFSGIPGVGDMDGLSISVVAADIGGLTASSTFTLTISLPTITGTAGNDILTGTSVAEKLIGLAGNDILDGGAGADVMLGGIGDDTYVVENVGDVVTENANEGIDTVQSAITYTLGNDVENLTLTGATTINATGNALNNILTGNSAANVLTGGAGDDTYVVGTGDTVAEDANAGIDTVQSSITYTLGANIENLTLIGTTAINATGNALNNILTGNSAGNVLTGGAGDDTYVVGTGDTVVEAASAGTDTVQSSITYTLGANVEKLTLTGPAKINGTGNTLDNVLDGSINTAANSLTGGSGNDTYIIGTGDIVVEAASAGTDTVQSSITYTLVTNVENLTLTGTTAINGTGNTLNNTLIGNSGNNVLSGGTGTDTLTGGLGNDTYVVDNTGDLVMETSMLITEIDTVQSSITYSLAALTYVENLTLTGSSVINGTGNALDNVLTGNSAANSLTGGAGNDTYIIGTGDTVVEAASAGTDTVQSSITYTLAANVENLTLSGTTAINGTGNTLDNVLTGNSAANSLTGGAGNDILTGGAGKDTIIGGAGADVIGLTEMTQVVDRVTVNAGDSLATGIDKISKFNATATLNDQLDFASTSIASNGVTNGTDVSGILSHSVTSGMIKFDDLDAYAAPLIINASNIAAVNSYLATNIATGKNVAFYVDANSNGIYTDAGDYLRVFQGGATAAGTLSSDDTFVDIFTTSGLGGVTALALAAAANTVQIV